MKTVKVKTILNIYSDFIDYRKASKISDKNKFKITKYCLYILNNNININLVDYLLEKNYDLLNLYSDIFKNDQNYHNNLIDSFNLALWSIQYGNKYLLSRNIAHQYENFSYEHKPLIDELYLMLLDDKLGIKLLNGAIYLFLTNDYYLVDLDPTCAKYIPLNCLALPAKEEFTDEVVFLLKCFLEKYNLNEENLLINEKYNVVVEVLSSAIFKSRELFLDRVEFFFGINQQTFEAKKDIDLLIFKYNKSIGIDRSQFNLSIHYYLSQKTPCFNLHDIMGHLNGWEYSHLFASSLKSYSRLAEKYPDYVPSIPSSEDYVDLPESLQPDSDAILIALTANTLSNLLEQDYQVIKAFEETSDIIADYLMAEISLPDPKGRKIKNWMLSKKVSIEKLLTILHYNRCEYITIFFELISMTQGNISEYSNFFNREMLASEKIKCLISIDYLLSYELYYVSGIPLFWACIKVMKKVYNSYLDKPKFKKALDIAFEAIEFDEYYFLNSHGKKVDILKYLLLALN